MESIERTEDVHVEENVTFEGLMLSSKTLRGLRSHGFEKPSPIQLKAIPLGRCGFDLIVEAKSGTGKTAVFGIIALEMLIGRGSGLQVLILAPTREIAAQIGDVIQNIGSAYEDLHVEIVMGGTNINDDITRLKNNPFQILVGSPGRILHLIKINAISTKSIRLFVLDEADRLMEESFQKDINYIYSQLPERKQLIAASATYTAELKDFLQRYMQTPSHIMPYSSSVLLGVAQMISTVLTHGSTVRQNKIKFDKLVEILSQVPFKQCLVFCRYQVRAQTICDLLSQEGWPAEYLASSQKQSERLDSLKKLQSYSCRILVATDLAARGIDATNVDLVINLDAPENIATYLHRIGRSGRYGSKGTAITIVTTGQEELLFTNMLNSLGDCDFKQFEQKTIEKNILQVNQESDLPTANSSSIQKKSTQLENIHIPDKKNSSLITVNTSPIQDTLSLEKNHVSAKQIHVLNKENFISLQSSLSEHKSELRENSEEKSDLKSHENRLSNVDLVQLMSYMPDDSFFESFESIVNSRDKFLKEKSSSNSVNSENIISNFVFEDYISEKNTNLLYYLDLNFGISNNKILDEEILNRDRPQLNLNKYPKYSPSSYDKNKPSVEIQSNNTVTEHLSETKINLQYKAEALSNAKVNKEEKKGGKKKVSKTKADKKLKNHTHLSTEEFYRNENDYQTTSEIDDVETENDSLKEYLYFKNQLEHITNQIQHSVYISTLLGNYNVN